MTGHEGSDEKTWLEEGLLLVVLCIEHGEESTITRTERGENSERIKGKGEVGRL